MPPGCGVSNAENPGGGPGQIQGSVEPARPAGVGLLQLDHDGARTPRSHVLGGVLTGLLVEDLTGA